MYKSHIYLYLYILDISDIFTHIYTRIYISVFSLRLETASLQDRLSKILYFHIFIFGQNRLYHWPYPRKVYFRILKNIGFG
jgi:hypothetical protein